LLGPNSPKTHQQNECAFAQSAAESDPSQSQSRMRLTGVTSPIVRYEAIVVAG
jgi:hypothetical protein